MENDTSTGGEPLSIDEAVKVLVNAEEAEALENEQSGGPLRVHPSGVRQHAGIARGVGALVYRGEGHSGVGTAGVATAAGAPAAQDSLRDSATVIGGSLSSTG